MPARTREVLTRPADGPDAVVRYGEHPDQLVDIHLPPAGPPAGVLVLLHGGFWRHVWNRRHTRPMAVALREQGWIVVTPEFRRTGGGGGWPGTFDDIATVRDRLPGLLADAVGATGPEVTGPATLVGHSAGGHLAMWWALTAPRPDTVRRVVALAPVADLARAYADELDGDAVAALLGGTPNDVPDRYEAADPARILRNRDRAGIPVQPPITVLHGSGDDRVPAAHSRDLPRIEYVELPGVGHFELIDPLSAVWPRVLAAL